MKSNIAIQIIKKFTIILSSLILLSIAQLIWWIVTGFEGDIWRLWGFIYFILISFLASFFLVWAYHLSYSIFWNQKHITNLSIFIQTTLIAIICYFSTEILEDILFWPYRIITKTKSVIEHPLEFYFPIAYFMILGFVYFSFIFIARNIYENRK